ncbi:MAG TPA: helix-turn-helix domain-containing protein [Lichenihabitans sp.]|jgi:DNA-binding transcriptional ArsR family regulator|nr:helix-turn-helix domain-containing protein [Lichenihabitans sp.]
MEDEPALPFNQAARCLADLGHPHRLQAFQMLVRAGEAGLAVGEIERALNIPRSTLAHHLAQLVASGLIGQTREGRIQRCRVDAARTRAVLAVLGGCCEGLPGLPGEFLKA